MFGEPEDVEGECNARLYLGDNYGDGTCTIRCQQDLGHEGKHRETFEREGEPVEITWVVDESAVCTLCEKRDQAHMLTDGKCCFKCTKCGGFKRLYRQHEGSDECDECVHQSGGEAFDAF